MGGVIGDPINGFIDGLMVVKLISDLIKLLISVETPQNLSGTTN